MKKLLFVIAMLLSNYAAFAQKHYTHNGKEYNLSQEVEGPISLYYTIDNNEYLYFISKNDQMTPLINTKDANGKFQEEYKEVLSIVTADAGLDIAKVKLTLASLKDFIHLYNTTKDTNYRYAADRPKPKTRFGAFAGVSNNPFVNNPDNAIGPIIGLDFEIYDVKRTRHSIFFGFKQSFESSKLKYSSSQIGLGYRFRIINKESFSLYPQATFATYTYASSETVETEDSETVVKKRSASNFDAPIIFALGADIKLGNGYLTLSANELFALMNLENQGNFPLDLRLGYRFNL